MADERSWTPRPRAISTERLQEDRALVQAIRGGSLEAWHRFVDRYGNLILSVIRRRLREGDDEVRSVFVDVLEHLYRTGFARYEGRAALSTWLVVITQGFTVDRIRRIHGRISVPDAVSRLGMLDRKVFQLHRRGLSAETIAHELGSGRHPVRVTQVLESLARIEATVDRHTLRRLRYAAQETSLTREWRRLREFLDSYREEAQRLQDERTPQQEMVEREAQDRLNRIGSMIEELPAAEREALRRHVLDGVPAREVARELGFPGHRRVYTIVDRALRTLRRWIEARGVQP